MTHTLIGVNPISLLTVTMKRKHKPKPQPPKWYFYDTDNCWDCKNRNGCGSCRRLKLFRHIYRNKKYGEEANEK